jgi:hypothetical protein
MKKTSGFRLASENLLYAYGYVKYAANKSKPYHSKWRSPNGDIVFMAVALKNVLDEIVVFEQQQVK